MLSAPTVTSFGGGFDSGGFGQGALGAERLGRLDRPAVLSWRHHDELEAAMSLAEGGLDTRW
jgi:hypothetical protein